MKAIINSNVVFAITSGEVTISDTAIVTEDCGEFQSSDLLVFNIVDIPEDIDRIPEVGDTYIDGVFTESVIKQKARWQEQADAIQANIDVVEKNTILNRGSRELELLTMEAIIAPQMAQLNHATVQQVLTASIYYQKLKALDTQVSNLRAEMASLWVLINS